MEPMVVMAAKAVEKVGAELVKAHQNRHRLDLQVEPKGVQGIDGLVTRVDRYAEELLISTLRKSYPRHRFIGEEFGEQPGQGNDDDWCWIIDPLDGTQNFVHGVPHFCISVAAQYRGVTQHGLIYDPVREEMFSASRGTGAILDQRRIRVSEKTSLNQALFAVGRPLMTLREGERVHFIEEHFASLQAVMQQGGDIRRTGSAALDLAYVAAGRFDGFFELGLKSWDIAAGALLVKEAGGTVVDARGGEDSLINGQVIASSMKLLKPLMQAVMPSWQSVLN